MLNGVDREGNFRVHGAYYYAVSERMFPYFHSHWCAEPDPFSEIYEITKDEIDEVVTYVDKFFMEGKPIPTFYELEAKFGRGKRSALIRIFRYCFLDGRFDPDFYSALLKPTEHPTEATGLCRELERDDFLLV